MKLNDWLKAIRKKKIVYNLSERELVLLAFETAEGLVSDFIDKELSEDPGITWTQLQEKLKMEYAGEPSAIQAMRSLGQVRQREGESFAELAERIKGLTLLAFSEDEIRAKPVLQTRMADCFIDALLDEDIKREVLKDRPYDVARCVQMARQSVSVIERARDGGSGAGKTPKERQKVYKPPVGRGVGYRRQENWEEEADPRRQNWSRWRGFHDPPQRRSGLICWQCRGEGHRSMECPSRDNGGGRLLNRPPERRREPSSTKPLSKQRNQYRLDWWYQYLAELVGRDWNFDYYNPGNISGTSTNEA